MKSIPRRKFWKKAVTRRAAVGSPVGKYEQNPVSEQTKCSVSEQLTSPDNVQAQSPANEEAQAKQSKQANIGLKSLEMIAQTYRQILMKYLQILFLMLLLLTINRG